MTLAAQAEAETRVKGAEAEAAASTPAEAAAKRELQTKPKKAKAVKAKAKPRIVIARGKRKRAIARAVIKPGTGRITLNAYALNALQPPLARDIILQPLTLLGERAQGIDAAISVRGGGWAGQAQAARTALARALTQYFKNAELRHAYAETDKWLLVEDPRRVEPKKFKGPKARARFTKSYR